MAAVSVVDDQILVLALRGLGAGYDEADSEPARDRGVVATAAVVTQGGSGGEVTGGKVTRIRKPRVRCGRPRVSGGARRPTRRTPS